MRAQKKGIESLVVKKSDGYLKMALGVFLVTLLAVVTLGMVFLKHLEYSETWNDQMYGVMMAVVLLFLVTAYVYKSFESFLRVQQLDMGILGFLGYNAKYVYRIYSSNINKLFFGVSVAATVYTIILGAVMVGFSSTVLSVIGLIWILNFIVNKNITYGILLGCVNKSILN